MFVRFQSRTGWFEAFLLVKEMVENYGSGGMSMGVTESIGGRCEEGDGIQGLEPKRPKV